MRKPPKDDVRKEATVTRPFYGERQSSTMSNRNTHTQHERGVDNLYLRRNRRLCLSLI